METLSIAVTKARILPARQTTDEWNTQTIQALVFEPLVRWQDGNAIPALAESWEVLEEGRRWVFRLREGARFGDGSPCTAGDVLRMIETVRSARDSFGMAGPYARYLADLTLSAPDERTVELRCPEPNGDIADFLCEIYIIKEDAQGRPVLGTGAYTVEDYANGEFVRLRRREDASPSLQYERLEFLAMPEAEERYQALVSGRVGLAMDLDQLEQMPAGDDFVWQQKANTLSVPFFLNGFVPPFNQPAARLGINLAVDRQALIDEVWGGRALPAATVVSPFHCGYDSRIQPLACDLERAKALFDQAGMPAELHLRTPTYMPERALRTSQVVAGQLARVGIKVRIEVVEDRPEYARQVGAKQIGHMALFDSSPHSTCRVLFDKISSRQRAVWWQGVEDPAADDLFAQAHAEYRPRERWEKYGLALRHLNQNPHWLYLYHPILVFACVPEVRGVELTHSGLLRFPGAW